MDKEQWIKIAKGAAIAVSGALLTYAANSLIPFLNSESGAWWGPSVAALLAIGIQTARKFIESVQSEGK